MWLFISNCPISSWSQRITVVLTWLFLVPLFNRDIMVANWHQTRGTSGLQLVRSSWGLLPWGNGQGAEGSHLCRWDVTLAPRIPVKWDLDKYAIYVLSPESSGHSRNGWCLLLLLFAVVSAASWSCVRGPAVLGNGQTWNRRAVSSPRSSQLGTAWEHRLGGHPKRRERRYARTNEQNTPKLWPVISIFLQASEKIGG